MYARFNNKHEPKKRVNVGTVGFANVAKAILRASIDNGLSSRNKSDRKRNRKDRWR